MRYSRVYASDALGVGLGYVREGLPGRRLDVAGGRGPHWAALMGLTVRPGRYSVVCDLVLKRGSYPVIRLRLKRMGAKKRPSYRIVAAESKSPRDGRFIESVGTYDPLTDPSTVRLNVERARHWLSVGAQPSDTVRYLLTREGVLGADGKLLTAEQAAAAAAAPAPVETTEVAEAVSA